MTAIQGYLEISFKKMSDEEFSDFTAKLKVAGIDFYRVGTGDEEYYHCLVQDPDSIQDVLSQLFDRTPVLQGAWDKHGVPFGKTKDAETGKITGVETYVFNKEKHIKHSKKIDPESGEVTTETEFKPLHQFFGWAEPTEY